jgi:hypothetical protein
LRPDLIRHTVGVAAQQRKTVIPIFFRDCKIPFQLRPFQHADFKSDYGSGLKSLLASLGVKSSAPGKSAPSAKPNAAPEIDLDDDEEVSIVVVPEPARAKKAAARKAPAKKTAVKKPVKKSVGGRSAAKTTKRGKAWATKKSAKKAPAKKVAVKKAAAKKATT